MASASSPPARATTSHRSGAAPVPITANGVVNRTGSGFHDGPAVVTRSRCTMSRPQISHAHGSYVGWDGPSSDSAASPRQARTSSRHGRGGPAGAAGLGGATAASSRAGAAAEVPVVVIVHLTVSTRAGGPSSAPPPRLPRRTALGAGESRRSERGGREERQGTGAIYGRGSRRGAACVPRGEPRPPLPTGGRRHRRARRGRRDHGRPGG